MNAHQLDADGVIINTIVVDSLDIFPGLVDARIGGNIGDSIIEGVVVPRPPVVIPMTESDFITAVQLRLDDFAKTRNYDGILSACTYATSAVERFQSEGQYCVESRDATWLKMYDMLAEVEAGTRPVPSSFADIEPELPVLLWPSIAV